MRTAITIGVIRDSEKVELIPAGASLREQLDNFKKRVISGADEKYSEVQVWASDSGIVKRAKFASRAELKKRADAKAALQTKLDAEAKAAADKDKKPADAKAAKPEAKAQPATK